MQFTHKVIRWCSNCNIPIIGKIECPLCSKKLDELNISSSDLRPVFSEEKECYHKLQTNAIPLPKNLCFESHGILFADGKRVLRVNFNKSIQNWQVTSLLKEPNTLERLTGTDIGTMLDANEEYILEMEKEAVEFLDSSVGRYADQAIISFSGGKDSMCSLALTRQVDKNIPVIFINSTIEFPETIEYVHNISTAFQCKLIELFPEQDFFSLCNQLGPPSCFMPWCCQTQKFSTLSNYINQNFNNGILSIEGLRNLESKQRMSYERISTNRSIARKTAILPIISWTTFDVWLYLLWRKLPINQLYKQGFKRVGCWICPHKSNNDLRLTRLLHEELVFKWENFLSNYAFKNGKDRTWISDGKWRCRRESYNRIGVCRKTIVDCSLETSFLYVISGINLPQLVEFMKIFSIPRKLHMKEQATYCVDSENIRIIMSPTKLMVTPKRKGILKVFERQLLKALNCIRCGTCMGTCQAIKVTKSNYFINTNMCTNCLKCTSSEYLRMGCIALNYKKNRFVWTED